MIYNVAGLLKESSGSVRRHDIAEAQLGSPEYGAFTGIHGHVKLMRTDQSVFATVVLEAVTEQVCSRCLEPARVEVTAEIEEEFLPVNSDLGGVRRESFEDDDPPDPSLTIDDHNQLDLREVALQSLAALVPMAPLCQPDCLGICPVCKRDRNKSSCECEQTAGRSQLAALASLEGITAISPGRPGRN